MICKFCGNVIEDNSDFCFICGQKVAAEAPAYAAEVYSQKPEGAPAEIAAEPVAAPVEPVYVAPEVPAEEESTKKGKKKAKKAKNAKKADKAELSKGGRFFLGLFAALFLIVAGALIFMNKALFAIIAAAVTAVVILVDYKKYKNAIAAGYEDKAADIVNTATIGLCVGMAVVVLALVKTYLF